MRSRPLTVRAVLSKTELVVIASSHGVEASVKLPGPFPPCDVPASMEAAVRAAFARLGDSSFELAQLTFDNTAGGFLPVSRLNKLRREVLQNLENRLRENRANRVAQLHAELRPPTAVKNTKKVASFRWSIKVDRISFLDQFSGADWLDVDEVIVDVTRDQPTLLREKLTVLEGQIGRERIRLALPALTRQWEEKAVLHKVHALRDAGWKKWEAANLSAWHYLGLDPGESSAKGLDLATDWSVYVLNRLAALQLREMGVTRFALSPEDGLENWTSLLAEFGPRAVLIVYQDTPLFLAESCAYANLIGGCPGKANCNFQSMDMISSHGEKVTALDYHCRTIVLNQGPYCLSTRLADLARAGATSLRADFIYRPYEAGEVKKVWNMVPRGQTRSGRTCGEF